MTLHGNRAVPLAAGCYRARVLRSYGKPGKAYVVAKAGRVLARLSVGGPTLASDLFTLEKPAEARLVVEHDDCDPVVEVELLAG